LDGVTDEASAKAAVDKLKATRDKLDAMAADHEALNPKPTPQEQEAVQNRYRDAYIELSHEIGKETRRIRKNAAMKAHLEEQLKWLEKG